ACRELPLGAGLLPLFTTCQEGRGGRYSPWPMGREAKPPVERTPYVVSSSLVCEGERCLPLYQIYHPGEAFAIALRSGVSRRSWSGRRRTSTIELLSSNRLCQKSMAWCACNT